MTYATSRANLIVGSTSFGNVSIVLNAAQTWTNSSTSTLTIVNNVNNRTSLLIVSGTGNTIINGVIGGGAGGITKNGAGVLTFSNANTFTGPITVSGGILTVASTGTINSTSGVVIGEGKTPENNAGYPTVRNACGETVNQSHPARPIRRLPVPEPYSETDAHIARTPALETQGDPIDIRQVRPTDKAGERDDESVRRRQFILYSGCPNL